MNIFVGNLSYEVTEDDLREEFSNFGEVASITIMKDKYTGQSRGFGFIEMPVLSEGQAAIIGLNGKMIHNRQINVSGARERFESGSRPQGGKKGGSSRGGWSRGSGKGGGGSRGGKGRW